MKRIGVLLFVIGIQLSLTAQIYVWKGGHALLENPDSITFKDADMGLKVISSETVSGTMKVKYIYLTKDYLGRPQWQSAVLHLSSPLVESKHIGVMALYNHYTIMRADECPTEVKKDLITTAVVAKKIAVVSADYEGFGESSDRMQAYCFGEANARSSIDALLAVREWLAEQGYTLSDTIINCGYSQGGQTTVAALRLSQTEYRDRVHFLRTFAGAGPYDLTLTFKRFLEWKKIGQPSILPLTIITLNELYGIGLKYSDVFKAPLSTYWKTWFVSKKFSMEEAGQLVGADSIHVYMCPTYLDITSVETREVMAYSDRLNVMTDWSPDADTELKIYHSKADDFVPFENSRELYRFFDSHGCSHVSIDSTSLTETHLISGAQFAAVLMAELEAL